MALSLAWLCNDRSVPRGRYWRSNLLVFCRRSARSVRRPTRTPGQIGVRSNSSARRPASDPRSRIAGPPSSKCDVAVSCPHSIFAKRLECCADQLSPPPEADIQGCSVHWLCPLQLRVALLWRVRSTDGLTFSYPAAYSFRDSGLKRGNGGISLPVFFRA